MKPGKTLQELAIELDRQNKAKKDYLLDTRNLYMDADFSGAMLTMSNPEKNVSTVLGINEIAHSQIGSALNIPSKYYEKMRKENPALLMENVNSWFMNEPKRKMVRTLDGTARAFLSDKYRRVDNYEIAQTVLPVIGELEGAKVESCEVTDQKMYIKVVNPRLEREISKGDIVQSGIIIMNSEVGLGTMTIQPLVYRLVCSNGMVVNDASMKKRHVGRINEASEDFSLFSSETIIADDKAMMLKIRDTVKAVVDEVQFEKVIQRMRNAKEAKLTSDEIPHVVELAAPDYGYTQAEGKGILDYLIRGEDLSLYGFANAVTRYAQDVDSYDRSTTLETIGYNILTMHTRKWNAYNAA